MIDVINNVPVSTVGLLLPKEKIIRTEYLKMFSTNKLEASD